MAREATMAREVPMEFSCHTPYHQKVLTAMARAIRKTARIKRSRRVRLYAWIIIGLSLVSHWLSCGSVWQMTANCVAVAALLLVSWKEDALNSYFAKRKALPGTDAADTSFYPDHYLVKTAAAESRWHYDKILALAQTQDLLIFVMGKDHALAMEKASLDGGSMS